MSESQKEGAELLDDQTATRLLFERIASVTGRSCTTPQEALIAVAAFQDRLLWSQKVLNEKEALQQRTSACLDALGKIVRERQFTPPSQANNPTLKTIFGIADKALQLITQKTS